MFIFFWIINNYKINKKYKYFDVKNINIYIIKSKIKKIILL